jgi:hypothetical protein
LPDVKGGGHDILKVQGAFRMGRFVFENLPIKINKQFDWWKGYVLRWLVLHSRTQSPLVLFAVISKMAAHSAPIEQVERCFFSLSMFLCV